GLAVLVPGAAQLGKLFGCFDYLHIVIAFRKDNALKDHSLREGEGRRTPGALLTGLRIADFAAKLTSFRHAALP
ncbi:MAG: hypothetical protein IKT16_05105, partial [Desulfovibrio sp.]|nr:hypothetical protein [Desulfovibrio sp.]